MRVPPSSPLEYQNLPACLNPTGMLVNTYGTKQGKTLAELSPNSAASYKLNPNFRSNRDPRMELTIAYPGSTFTAT